MGTSQAYPSTDPRSEFAPADPSVDAMVEQLQRDFAAGGHRCYVLVDPAKQRADDDPFDGPLFKVWPRTVLHVQFWSFPRAHKPYLLALDLSRYLDSEILRASVRMALEDRRDAVIDREQGHRIAGWLAASAPADSLVRALGRHTIQSSGPGEAYPFRYYDMRTLTWFWPLLRAEQRQALFGPLAAWYILDARHQLQKLQAPEGGERTAALALDAAQWRKLRRIGVVNRALATYQKTHERAPDTPQLSTAWNAAGRALDLGLDDADDMAALVSHALQWHPLFDTHPVVDALLKRRDSDQSYRGVIGELEPAQIDRIRGELQERTLRGER
ncbi:MAG: DUF4123 domain-containing protein [Acidihalobacter sp.]